MKKVQKPRKPLIVYYLIALGVLIVINFIVFPMMMNGNIEEVDYGTFLTMVEEKQVSKVQRAGGFKALLVCFINLRRADFIIQPGSGGGLHHGIRRDQIIFGAGN